MLLDADPSLCPKVKVSDYLGCIDEFPIVRCYLRCPFYTGWIDAIRAPIKFATVLVGNIPGVRDPQNHDHLQTTKDPLTADISYPKDPLPTDPLPTPAVYQPAVCRPETCQLYAS